MIKIFHRGQHLKNPNRIEVYNYPNIKEMMLIVCEFGKLDKKASHIVGVWHVKKK